MSCGLKFKFLNKAFRDLQWVPPSFLSSWPSHPFKPLLSPLLALLYHWPLHSFATPFACYSLYLRQKETCVWILVFSSVDCVHFGNLQKLLCHSFCLMVIIVPISWGQSSSALRHIVIHLYCSSCAHVSSLWTKLRTLNGYLCIP
jgi:hypothetical protein